MIILGSRGRPEKLQRFFSRGEPQMPGLVVLDEDDPRLPDYERIGLPEGWRRVVYPKTTLVRSVNRAVGEVMAAGKPLFVGWMADDAVPETFRWDVSLAVACGEDEISYPEDGVHGRPSHFFVGGGMAKTLWDKEGWFVPPCLKHLYFDTFYEDLGIALGKLKKLPSIVVRHAHFSVGAASLDDTYRGRQSSGDKEAYARFLVDDMPRIVGYFK